MCCRMLALSLIGPLWAFVPPVSAWELKLNGTFNYVYEYFGQEGDQGFFGKFNLDRSMAAGGLAAGDFSTLNGWVGGQIGHQGNELSSGADAAKHYQNLDLWPEFVLTQAVRFRGRYRLGDYGDPSASDYITNTRPGTEVATSDGQWTMWCVTAQTPLGILAVGKRPQTFGCGLQYNGEANLTTEGVAIIVPFGPLRISYAVRPFWEQPPASPYYNPLDKSGVRQLAHRCFVTYRAGAIDAGFQGAWTRFHAGPESQGRATSDGEFRPKDAAWSHGTVYIKYFDGAIFFNAELAYYEAITNRLGRVSSGALGPSYQESWRFMTESGAILGPGRVALLYAFMPGPDRRARCLINKQSCVQSAGFGAYSVFRPYSFLLGYGYGGGVNAYDLNSQGYINDAWVAAGRFDYAVASNLNVFGSFLWAERTSHGYGWGYIRPAQRGTGSLVVNAAGTTVPTTTWTPQVRFANNDGAGGAPSIPDLSLGWEITAGIDWKLLEKYRFSALVAYWQPGKWFNYACVDRGVPGWNVPTAANRWGVSPGRSIDAIVGSEIRLTVDF